MIHIKPTRLVHQHENLGKIEKVLQHGHEPTFEKDYAKLGGAKTGGALDTLNGFQKLTQPTDSPEKREDDKDTMQSSTEDALKEQMKQVGLKPVEYNIARHPFMGVWFAKKKIEAGGIDKSKTDYQASREDVIKFSILMGGSEVEEYEIGKTLMGTYSAKKKASLGR